MSGQNPSAPCQPPKSAALHPGITRGWSTISESAVSDTPTAGPVEHRTANDFPFPSQTPTQRGLTSQPQQQGVDPADYKTKSHPLRENENVDGEQMAPEGEGKAAEAVERTRRGSVMGEGGEERWRERQKSLHGRGRGEFTFEGGDAELERLKVQQSWAREQAKEKRRAGEDVDGGVGAIGRTPDRHV